MTIDLILTGKTDFAPVEELVRLYTGRTAHYVKMNVITLPDVRGAARGGSSGKGSEALQRRREGEALLKALGEGDYLVVLDERGEEFSSAGLAAWLQKRLNSGVRRLVFAIGGPYGFSDEVYTRAEGRLSLSRMTFSHQIVRAIFCEQLYRAFTILNNEPYHHE